MASAIDLDFVLIRSREEKKIARHVLELLQQHDHVQVCKTLLNAIDEESLDLRVFSVFLSATKSIDCILLCLHQPCSVFVRRQGIKQFGRAWGDRARWEQAWSAIGETNGILQLLSELSVLEVKLFFQAMGNNVRGRDRPAERAHAMELLVQAMYPELFPVASLDIPDKRPLKKYAIPLLPVCSTAFVENLLVQHGGWSNLWLSSSKKRFMTLHEQLFKNKSWQMLCTQKEHPFSFLDARFYLMRFTTNEPSMPSKERKFSMPMLHSEAVLKQSIKIASQGTKATLQIPESSIYSNLLRRAMRKKVPLARLHKIMALGLDLYAVKDMLSQSFEFIGVDVWRRITEYWIMWPEHWSDLFIRGLQLGLGGSPQNIPAAFLKVANMKHLNKDRMWPLLRLFCLHMLKDGIDIDTSTDLKVLAKQKWTVQILQKLPDDKIIHLLKLLLRVNQNTNFLQGASRNSILTQQHLYEQHNFNVSLYLTQLQANSDDQRQRYQAHDRVEDMLEELRKTSGASRDQPKRAEYAKAAGLVAIASGSLELFGDHVEWLQRFVRDPLTVKVVFSAHAIASSEASNLLSGITDTYVKNLTLGDVSKSVAKANAILLMLHTHRNVAKREPSYQDSDWNSLATLVQNAVRTRISRAKKLQKTLNASQGELYSAIWSQSFAMFSQVGASSMRSVQGEIRSLMTALPPTTLATTTRAMLETDDKYRATKASGKEAEDESRIIESLTYQCLLALAHSDKPALAQELIVRTIIDRPDASSWHRQMLSINFFRRLPARNAEKLLLSFAKAIGEKLEEQSYIRVGEATGAPSMVKVTTVKYLAQLLQDATFLSPDASIDVLLELFKVATHPDIRFATLESMLATLKSLVATEVLEPNSNVSQITNPLVYKILMALDAVIPVAGSINERRPPKEQDWVETQSDSSQLPEVLSGQDRPLWNALTHAARSSENLRAWFVTRLLLPTIKASITEHTKWLSLFCKKHAAPLPVQELPSIPVVPQMLRTILDQFPTLAPVQILRQLDLYIRFMLQPPRALTAFIAKLKSDEDQRNKPDVKHFLAIFDQSPSDILRDYTYALINRIHHSFEPSILPQNKGIASYLYKEAILPELAIVLDRYDERMDAWNKVVEKLRHSPNMELEDYQKWKQDCRPLLEDIINMVEERRTQSWLRDPRRKPSVLPSTNRMKLWILDYPEPKTPNSGKLQLACRMLASQINEWLQDCLASPIIRIDALLDDISSMHSRLSKIERIHVGIALGSGSQQREDMHGDADAVLQVTRVRAALGFFDNPERDALLIEMVPFTTQMRASMGAMFKGWETSALEEVRMICLEWRLGNPDMWEEIMKGGAGAVDMERAD